MKKRFEAEVKVGREKRKFQDAEEFYKFMEWLGVFGPWRGDKKRTWLMKVKIEMVCLE